jgi:hypothetical protein
MIVHGVFFTCSMRYMKFLDLKDYMILTDFGGLSMVILSLSKILCVHVYI